MKLQLKKAEKAVCNKMSQKFNSNVDCGIKATFHQLIIKNDFKCIIDDVREIFSNNYMMKYFITMQ